MDFLADSLAIGLLFLCAGAGAVLATLPRRFKAIEIAVAGLFLMFMAAPVAGFDVSVPWPEFAETCLAGGLILFVIALVRTARLIMAGQYRALR